MRWQRVARLGVAAAGLTCAAAIYFAARGHQKPPPSEPLIKPDKDAVTQGGQTTIRRGENGQERFTLECKSFATYADERTKCQTGHLTTFDDRPFQVWADDFGLTGKSVQADNPAEIHLTGHVKIRSHDGLEVTTEAATYNDVTGIVTVPGALHFARERMSGDAIGGSYDRDHDTLRLLDKTHFLLAPDASGLGAMDATSRTMTLIRPERRALLDQDAHILHDGDTLAGRTAMIFLTDDEQEIKLVELRQNSSVAPGTGPGSHPPAMRADDIDLGFLPNGRTVNRAKLVSRSSATSSLVMTNATGSRSIAAPSIDVDLADDGQTVTRLAANDRVTVELPASGDTPARTIRAATLNAQGAAPAGLKTARFDRNVQFDERAAEPRTVKSGVLLLDLDGQLDSIKSADFRQNVQLTGQEGMAASAEQAMYEAAKNLLHLLRPDLRSKRPHAENKDVVVDGESIDMTLDSNALQASGAVTTQSRAKTAQAAGRPSALFDETKPIFGSSAQFTYRDKIAVYRGGPAAKALLQQDQNQVSGDTLTLESETNNLKGDKHVETHFLVQPRPDPAKPNAPPGKPTVYVVTGDTLDYQDAAGKAIFKGAPAHMSSPEGKTEGKQIDLWLAADGHTLEKFVVTGEAYSEMDQNRRAVGEVLTYIAATDSYTLTGPGSRVLIPKTKDSKDGKPTDCVLSLGSNMTFSRQSGNAEGYSSQNSVSCSVKIR